MAQGNITGLFQYLKWGVGTASNGLGLWTGGDLSNDPDARSRQGVGGNEIRRGGLCKFGLKADFYVSASNQALVGYGLRNAYPRGTLQELAFEGGADQWGRAYSTAVITEWSLDWAVEEALKASITVGALSIAAAAGSSMPAETALDFEDYDFTALFGGAEYGVTALSVKVNNNVTFKTNGNAKSAGSIRWPVYYLTGAEDLTVDITCGTPLSHTTLGLFADDLASNLGATLVGNNGVNTCTLTLSNLQPSGPESFGQADANTEAGWKYSFKGSRASGSATWAWA